MASELAGWQVIVVPSAIALAVGFSAAVGVVFGWHSALKPRGWTTSRRCGTSKEPQKGKIRSLDREQKQ